MGLPGKRDEPMRAGITAIVFMKMFCVFCKWLSTKSYRLKRCADYPVFPLFWAIFIVKFYRCVACCNNFKNAKDSLLVIARSPE